MISIVIGVLSLLAALAWVLAVISLVQIMRTAPSGDGLKTLNRLGWWRFSEIRAANGPAVERHIQTYQRAFVAFFVCALAAIAVSALLSITAQN